MSDINNFEKLLEEGELSHDGFMGTDTRSYSEIINADSKTVAQLGLTNNQIAARLAELTEAGSDIYERDTEIENKFIVHVRSDRGPMPDPFGGSPLRKGDTILKDKTSGKEFIWNALTIRFIAEHGFFSGIGSQYRLEPKELAEYLF